MAIKPPPPFPGPPSLFGDTLFSGNIRKIKALENFPARLLDPKVVPHFTISDAPRDRKQLMRQVWVVGAELEPGVLSAGSSSFVVVDFFDFESQATPLLPGESPAFDFATTFKVR